jgi:putative nucleotidyltransferase with HDIG domain
LTGDAITTNNPLLRLVGYLHDVGKPVSQDTNPLTGEVWFKGHEDTGAEIVEKELTALKFSNVEVKYVSNLVKFHMHMTRTMGPKAVRRLLRSLNEVGLSWRDLLRLRLADKRGNLKKSDADVRGMAKEYIKKFLAETKRKNLPLTVKDLVVDGNDVMKELGICSCPLVGQVLKHLLDLVLEDPDRNERDFLINQGWVYICSDGE